MKKLLENYFKLQKEIYDYFGYKEDWVKIPIEPSWHDNLHCKWYFQPNSDGRSGTVWFSDSDSLEESAKEGNDLYSNEIYTQRFLPKWVYRTADYTMIVVDTRTDGNHFLQIFANENEIKEPSKEFLEALHRWR